MKRTFAALATAAAVGAAGLTAAPQKAEAYPVWVVPAIIGGVVGGVALGAIATHAQAERYGDGYAYEPDPRAPRGTTTRPLVAWARPSAPVVV